ncbi:conserved hypothetical protein [Neospora caninum Liverpool]|uniref:N(6)-L-threonylcarbamoyladenine synthase n=1 Tax=Neospora caninum (strain Liverpool) TaxID=572307 RepID=F0VIL5_NEOCL|nr:conserved hypothetical protein [Neospora caninum Liverpool]CBZ53576.1 conserved hypothetical protein [Neospora caninum Liverpool]|eukprot:XP_003883608.1 conserved hypothetical protein [Neospora caninum Liverpool]
MIGSLDNGGSPILGSPFSRFGHDGRQTGFEGVSAAWKPSPRRDWPGEEPGNRTKSPERRCLGARPVGSVTRGSPREFRRHLMQWKRASPLASTPFHKAPAGMRAVTEEESKRRTVVRSLDHPESDWEWGPAHRLATRGEDVAEREGRTTAKHPSCISRRKDRRREEPGRELREERTEGLRLSPQTACLAEQRDPRQGGKPFVPAKVEAARGRTFPVEEETPFLEPEEAIRRKWSDLRRQHHERHKGGGRTLVLGIETSCDDTCVGIVEGESGRILANVCTPQPELLIKYGGVHPSEAAAAHDRRMRSVVRNALQEAGVSLLDIDIIAFTRGPGIVPCLSVGASAALEIAGELTEAWADAEAKLFANPSSVSSLSDDASSLARAPSVVAENGGSLRDSVRKQARSGYRVVDSVAAEDPKQRTSTETERREAHEALEGTQVTGERPENAGDLDPEAGRELSWLSKEERDAMLRRLASDNAPEWQADEKLSRGRPPLVVAVNHLHGHLLSAGRDTQAKDASGREDPICSPACYLPPTFLALLVSGGHTFSCVVKACEENHLHLRPKLFLVPTRGRRNRSGGHPRGGDISGEASEKGHDTETKEKNGKGEEGVERAEEIKVHSDTGVERIQGQSRESLRGPSHRVETPGKGGPERKDSGYAPGMRRGETNGHDAEEREAATRRRDPEGSDEPGNVSRDALVEVWGTWEDPEAANPDGCVSGLQCIYTGQTEDDAVGEAIDKSMRCLKTAASSSPPAPRSSSAAGFRSSAAPSLGFPTVLLTASPSSPSPSLCPRASPLRPAHSSDTDASRESSPGARGATAESRGICDDNEGAPGSRGSTSREAARTGRGAGLEGRHGGALMEEMAAAGNASVPLPNMLCLKPKTLNFSFSGLKSAFATAVSKAAQLKDDEQGQCDFAASLQAAVFKHLEDQLRKTMWLYEFLDNFPRSLAVVGEALRDAPPSEAPVSRPAGKQLARRSHICKGRMQTEAATDREACRVGSEKNPPDRGHREDRDEGGGAQALEANTQQQQLQKLRDGAEGNFVCSPDGSGEEIRNLKVIVAKSNDKKLVTPKWLGGISLCADDLLSKVEFLILDWIVKSKVMP